MNKIRRPIVFIRNKVLKNIRGLSWMDKATRFLILHLRYISAKDG